MKTAQKEPVKKYEAITTKNTKVAQNNGMPEKVKPYSTRGLRDLFVDELRTIY